MNACLYELLFQHLMNVDLEGSDDDDAVEEKRMKTAAAAVYISFQQRACMRW